MPPGRREPLALLIFTRGRWQSVPPGCGFAVARRGRLQELRSRTVSGALRRLQLWLPSKARLGSRLSFKKIPPSDGDNSDNDATLTEPKQITPHNRDVRPCKRTRDITSSEEEEPIQRVTTVATVHAAKQRKISKNHQTCVIQLLSSESKSSEKSRPDLKKQTSKEILIKSPKKLSETSRTDLRDQKSKEIMESPKKSSVSVSRILLDSPKRSLSLKRKRVEQTYPSKESSPILKSKDLSDKQISRYLQSRSGKQNKNPKKSDAIMSDSDFETDQSDILKFKIKKNHSPKKINSISNSEFGPKYGNSSSKTQKKFYKIGPKRQKLDQDPSESETPKNAENIFKRPNENRTQKSPSTQTPNIGTCRELDIDEEDIELLRIFIQNHCTDRELLKFDADDEYKKMIFFRINPLVNIEWCPIIDRMLRRSQDSQITLTDFASNLGLRAASIKTQRYKIRQRTEKSYVASDSDSSSEDKENNDKMPRRREKMKILKEREYNMRESNRENKAKESKNKVSNERVLTRKRAESDSEESNAKENNKKEEIAKKRMTRTNHNTVKSESEKNKVEKAQESYTVESDSKESNAKENNKKARIAKERTTKSNHNTVDSDSEASNTKENKKVSNTKKQTNREVRNKENSDSNASNAIKNNTKVSNAKKQTEGDNRNSGDSDSRKGNAKRVDQKEIDNTVDTVELSSESGTVQTVKAIKKTAKPKPVISSKRRGNLEYSSLEDQAIVAWVSNGSRASRVNGNLLWRQFEDQYKQITGNRRTWHSLRNRYLRYILPKLGSLALPLSQQTRLRAAAATGEIKGRKVRPPRRNSIFTLPPRGAASRRLAAADDTQTEKKELSNRSPRYSSLTRQFTRRHNLTRPSSELSDSSQRSNKLEVTDGKKPEAKGNSPKKPHRAINSSPQHTTGKAVRNRHSDSERSEAPRRNKDSSDSSGESEDESKKTNEPRRTRRSVNDANKRMSRTGETTRNAHSDSDKRSESPRRDKDSSDSSSESEDESKEPNEPRRTRRSVNDANKRMSRTGETTRNAHSDSDKRSESPRRDKDSSDSSSESEDESKEPNEPRRTRRSVNDANKRMSRTGETTRNAHSDSDKRSESPRRDKDSSDSSSESEDESKEINEPRRTRRSVNDANKRMSKTGETTRNALGVSDKLSESPRRDKDSSDSSSESEDESKEPNEPRRTRRSVNDASKRMSRIDTGQNTNESKRRLTRQSNILDESYVSKSLKARGVADKQKAAREKTNESPRRNLNRHKSPSEQTSRDSSESMSQSRRKSPVNNRRRSRRDTNNRDKSDNESNESKRRKSPVGSIRRSPMRKFNTNTSPSKQGSKGLNTSVSQVRRQSKSSIKRKNARHVSSEESDSTIGLVSQPRRKSNRINSPQDRSNRRKSNRLRSPMKQNGRLSSDSPRRKSNRLTPNESSNKRRRSSESKRKSKLAKRDSLDVIVASDSSESFETKKVKKDLKKNVDQPRKRVDKQKRRLFNPKAIL